MNKVDENLIRLRASQATSQELVECMVHPSILVRSKAIVAGAQLQTSDSEQIVAAIRGAANHAQYASVKLMGSVYQRHLAIAALAWLKDGVGMDAFSSEVDRLAQRDREIVEGLVANGPIEI
ncbi:MAG: hypothetical protein IPN71_09790 [Fibrobacteres bacterium]|nr:hypothetical protein [Fibrobacterota bacterium]